MERKEAAGDSGSLPSEGSGHQGRRQAAGTSGTDWMAGKRSDCYASAGWSVMIVPVSAGIRAADPALYSGTYHRGGKKGYPPGIDGKLEWKASGKEPVFPGSEPASGKRM